MIYGPDPPSHRFHVAPKMKTRPRTMNDALQNLWFGSGTFQFR